VIFISGDIYYLVDFGFTATMLASKIAEHLRQIYCGHMYVDPRGSTSANMQNVDTYSTLLYKLFKNQNLYFSWMNLSLLHPFA